MLKPDILLLDEPFSALDYQNRLTISDDVYKIIKNENKTTVMVTHDVRMAEFADKVVNIHDGKIVDIQINEGIKENEEK